MYTLYSYLSWEFHGMHNTYTGLTQIYGFFVQMLERRCEFSPLIQCEFGLVRSYRQSFVQSKLLPHACQPQCSRPSLRVFSSTFPFSRAFARFDAMAPDGSKDTAVVRSGISHRSNDGSDTSPGAFSNATAVTRQRMELRSPLFFQGGDYSLWWIILFWLWRVLYQHTLPRLHHALFFFSRRLSLCSLLCVTTFFRSNAPLQLSHLDFPRCWSSSGQTLCCGCIPLTAIYISDGFYNPKIHIYRKQMNLKGGFENFSIKNHGDKALKPTTNNSLLLQK